MPEEDYASKLSEWENFLSEDYSVNEPVKDWRIMADTDPSNGLPLFESIHPSLTIIPRLSRKSAKQGFDWSVRYPCGQLTVNMHSDPNQGQGAKRRFCHLSDEFIEKYAAWVEFFKIDKIKFLQLHYVNALTRKTIADFAFVDDSLHVGKIIKIFSTIPGQHRNMVPPFSCEAGVELESEFQGILNIKLNNWTSKKFGDGLNLSFICSITPKKPKDIRLEAVSDLLEEAHAHIINHFEAIFTDEAKNSFKPSSK